jgi:hypothetical protein
MEDRCVRGIWSRFAWMMVLVGSTVLALNANAAPPLQVAYAHVLGNGTLDAANSKNVVAMDGGNGLFCFKLAFRPKNTVATLAVDPTAPNQSIGFIKAAVPPTDLFTCAKIPKPDAVVETGKETAVNSGESAGGFAFYVYWTR